MTSATVTNLSSATDLLAEAAEWRLLGLLFACPHGDWHEQVSALSAEVQDEALRDAARAALEEATESVYHTAFGPGGPATPREVSHRHTALTGQYLAEVLGCYHAFAYCPPRDDPPDHIATEIDFVAYLCLKQTFAAARNDETQAAVTAEAAQSFIQEHLATIAVPLSRILDASGISYLTLAIAALSERIEPYCNTTGVPSTVLDQPCDRSLPIHDTSDCCSDFCD